MKNIQATSGINSTIVEELASEGIIFKAAPLELMTIRVIYMNMPIMGIGIRNNYGGYEFYARHYFKKPVTLLKSGSSTIHFRINRKTCSCCIFSDLLDYLSYCSITDFHKGDLPRWCDCIIIGNPSNFVNAMLDAESYDVINCILPNTDEGRTMFSTIQQRSPLRTRDYSALYRGYDSLKEYVTTQNTE